MRCFYIFRFGTVAMSSETCTFNCSTHILLLTIKALYSCRCSNDDSHDVVAHRAASAICGRSSFLLFHPGQCNEVGSFFRSFGSAPIQLNLFSFSVILATIATSYKALHVLHAFMHEYIITLLAYKVTNTAQCISCSLQLTWR